MSLAHFGSAQSHGACVVYGAPKARTLTAVAGRPRRDNRARPGGDLPWRREADFGLRRGRLPPPQPPCTAGGDGSATTSTSARPWVSSSCRMDQAVSTQHSDMHTCTTNTQHARRWRTGCMGNLPCGISPTDDGMWRRRRSQQPSHADQPPASGVTSRLMFDVTAGTNLLRARVVAGGRPSGADAS